MTGQTAGNRSFSARLRELSNQHFKGAISLQEYRQERKKVLDTIDQHFNGTVSQSAAPQLEKREDATVPYFLEDTTK